MCVCVFLKNIFKSLVRPLYIHDTSAQCLNAERNMTNKYIQTKYSQFTSTMKNEEVELLWSDFWSEENKFIKRLSTDLLINDGLAPQCLIRGGPRPRAASLPGWERGKGRKQLLLEAGGQIFL